jgi:hypothetical protein
VILAIFLLYNKNSRISGGLTMKVEEQKIIKEFLVGAYMSLQEVRRVDETQRLKGLPRVSKELACSQREYDVLCALAKRLGVTNPCERHECEILCVED